MDTVGARTAANAMSPFLAVRSSQTEAQSVSGSFSSFAKAHVAAAEVSAAVREKLQKLYIAVVTTFTKLRYSMQCVWNKSKKNL